MNSTKPLSRRALLGGATMLGVCPGRADGATPIPEELKTPYKLNRLVVAAAETKGSYDERAVDCPFVFRNGPSFYMTFVGFDGRGYQTGLASSDDLIHWKKEGVIAGRDPSSDVRRFNVALNWIVRDNSLFGDGQLKKVKGRFLGVYHSYPSPGYEEGPAVIGLCWSSDLRKWEFEAPFLKPQDGAAWERGGLYKPCLVEENGIFYLFYNAKTSDKPWREQTGVAISGDLRTWKRHEGNPIIANGGPGSVDEVFASDPCVLRFLERWAMFYYSLDAKGVARDVLALSNDLLHPVKCDGVLIDVGAPGSVDARYAHKPSVIAKGGALFHFYCAVSKDDVRGISVACSRPIEKA